MLIKTVNVIKKNEFPTYLLTVKCLIMSRVTANQHSLRMALQVAHLPFF